MWVGARLQGHVPRQPGAPLSGGAELDRSAEPLSPMAEVLESEATRRRVGDAAPVVGDDKTEFVADGDRDDDLGGPSVFAHIRQGLPEHGEHLLRKRVAEYRVHRAAERDLREDAEHRPQLVDQVEDLRMQPLFVDRELDVENRLAQLADGFVELVDRLPDPHDGFRPLDQAGCPLQRQTYGEEPLDHRVVQVAGDPVPVLGERPVAHQAVQARVLDGDARGHGEGQDQLLVVIGELRGGLLVGHVEDPVDLAVHPDRDTEEGRHSRVVCGESEALRAGGDIGQAKRLVLRHQSAKDAASRGAGADGPLPLGAQADGQELVQSLSVLGQDTQCPVPGVHQVASLLADPPEHHRQIELGIENEDRLHQLPQLGGIVDPVEGLHETSRIEGDQSSVRAGGPIGLYAGPDGRTATGGVALLGKMTIRVFLLDDHELVRTGLRTLLEAEDDMEVVGEVGTAGQGLRLIRELLPDVAILDVRLPDGNGIEVCREVQSSTPQVRCLMLTSYSDDDALFSSIMAGASGYVLKEVGGGDLLGDIRRVSQGISLLDPVLTQDLFERLRKDREAESRLTVLTPQERKVLELIAQGQSNRQIAEQLFLAEATVKNYVSSLLSKLGMRRRTEAAVYAAVLAERKAFNPKN